MKSVLTKSAVKIILANRLIIPSRRIADLIGCSKFVIQRYLAKNGLTPPAGIIEQFRVRGLTGRTIFTKKEDTIIKKFYLILPEKTLARKLNRSHTGVHTRMRQMGLVIPPELIQQRKEISRLKPGNIPPNKGKKWNDFMSKEGQKRSRGTTFKKKHLPHNTLFNNCKRIRTDTKTGRQYLYIRVKLARWIPYHQWLWRQKYGRIPRKHIIVFKDGDTMNLKISNLELITLKQNMLRNTLHNYPKEIAQIIQLTGALKRQINKHEKQNN